MKTVLRQAEPVSHPVHIKQRRKALPTNAEIAVAVFFIIVLLIAVSLLGFSIQSSVTARTQNVTWQHEQARLVLTLKNDITESMFPPHDFLITGEKNEQAEFNALIARVNKLFDAIKKTHHIKDENLSILTLARQKYFDLEKIEEEIMSIPDPVGNKSGVRLMEEMHRYQGSILRDLEKFVQLENKQVTSSEGSAWAAERRAFMVIQALTVFMVMVVLVIGYIGRRNGW